MGVVLVWHWASCPRDSLQPRRVTESMACAMALQPDGAIVIAGYVGEIRSPDFGSHILAYTVWVRIEGGDSLLSAPWSESLPAATVGEAYSADAVTGAHSGGTPPVTYTAAGLPDGLAISATGRITGIPTAAGSSLVTVGATDKGCRCRSSPTRSACA